VIKCDIPITPAVFQP